MAMIGIDLGTTNSLACICRGGRPELIPNALGNVLTPSAVSIREDGSISVGEEARERLISHPEASAASFKRFMGTDRVFELAGRRFTPQELSSFVLRQLKEDAERYLGEEVTEAVISVPAYFNDNQRYATREAGILAGLRVERLINEPSAAALAASRISGEEEAGYLVVDFGGGTLDVSVVDCFENVIEILAVSGENHLGGDDFDQAIGEAFCRANGLSYENLDPGLKASILRLAEKAKKELTVHDQAQMELKTQTGVFRLSFDSIELARMCGGIFDRMEAAIRRALKDSGRLADEIGQTVLAGGSCRMPVVAFYLEALLGQKPRSIGTPDEIVAMGAGICAGIKERREEIKDLVLTDICPFTLGVGVDRGGQGKLVMSPVIERNTILPASRVGFYTNRYDGQEKIKVCVYQGEEYFCQDNLELGEIEIDIPPMKRGGNCIEVRFTYDINGILEVEVTDQIKKQTKRRVLSGGVFRMSQEALQKRLLELSDLKLLPPGGARARLAAARGERLFSQLSGSLRRQAEEELDRLWEAVGHGNDQEIENAARRAEQVFKELEKNVW